MALELRRADLPRPMLRDVAEQPCRREECTRLKRHALQLAMRIEELTQERDALLARPSVPVAWDWSALDLPDEPPCGEALMRVCTATEARIVAVLLAAGRDAAGVHRVVSYGRLIPAVWGTGYDGGSGDLHILRVNKGRLIPKLKHFGWTIRTVTALGLALEPWAGERPPLGEVPTRAQLNVVSREETERMAALRRRGWSYVAIGLEVGRADSTVRRRLKKAGLS